MLSKANRLRRGKDFALLRRWGRSVRGETLLVRFLVERSSAPARSALIIAKKTFPKAVVRNAIRRKIRAILSGLLPRVSYGALVLVIVGPRAATMQSPALKNELTDLLTRARLFRL